MASKLWERFEQNVANHPAKAAYIIARGTDWQTVAFEQLWDLSLRFARGLEACRLTPGVRVALMVPPSVEFFATAFALIKTGLVPIVLDPAIGLKNVAACMNESEPQVFIGNTLTHFLQRVFGWGKNSVKYKLTLRRILNPSRPAAAPTFDTDVKHIAVIYTSGSTGLPKGAMYTERNFSAQLDMLAQTFGIQPDEIDLPAFPLYALIDSLLGVTSIIPDIRFPAPGKTNPERMIRAIQKFHVTNMFASPVVLDVLAKYGEKENVKLPSLRRVITAGAPASVHLQERFRKLLCDETSLFGVYGATEVLPIAVVESREVFSVRESTENGAGVCLGKPVNGSKVRIVQITEEPIQSWEEAIELIPNQIGEITVKGEAVTAEYLARPEANRLAKIREGEAVVHRTGDVGYFDEEGRLWYCGRKTHRVKTDFGVLFTEQVEGIFNAHPRVYRTALVGVRGKPVLWVELEEKAQRANQESIQQELIALGKGHPQASKVETFLFMKKFPTDVRHNSKIIREKLTILAEQRLN